MIIIEWATEHLAVLTTQGDEAPVVQVCEGLPGSNHANTAFTIAESAEYIRNWLDSLAVGKGKTLVVLPREAVVTRRLQLPNAPENELPDMVRFQAATKTSSSLDDLALDFLPLSGTHPGDEQHVLTVTLDRQRLSRMTAVLEAAGLHVETVTTSPLTIAQLVKSRFNQAMINKPALLVFQQSDRVEISILDEGSLVFTHSMRISRDGDFVNLKPLRSEITRSVVALEQFHPDVEIDRCYYIGTHENEVTEFLSSRFKDSLELLSAPQLMSGSKEGFEALVGAVQPVADRSLALDLLHPRKRIEKPDRRKWYWIAGGVAVALIFLFSYAVFRSRKIALEDSIALLNTRQLELDDQLKKGAPRLVAHERINNWTKSQVNPIEAWTKLQALLPGTERLYLSDLKFAPQKSDVQVQFTGVGYAKNRKDVDDLKDKLADNGFRVKPQPTVDSNKDPDYPVRFELFVELMRPTKTTSTIIPKTAT